MRVHDLLALAAEELVAGESIVASDAATIELEFHRVLGQEACSRCI
jgi:hypothetical protein